MKKVIAFIGSPRKHSTYQALQEFEQQLKNSLDIDFEYVFLKDYRLDRCHGCLRCFDEGEEKCPLQDDRDLLVAKMDAAHGVIFATPNYSFHVSALMKTYIDRLAFIFHRPRFFGKVCTALVMQGIYGGNTTRTYLEKIGANWGFRPVKGCVLTALEPRTEKAQKKISNQISKAATRFAKALNRDQLTNPSFYRLMMFRFQRTGMKGLQDDHYKDYRYFKEQGWFESDYFYPVSLSVFKKVAGSLFDRLGRRLFQQ
ncbi:MAG TPA: NADPH-dependent FMN reductase [Anaerolineaceae bacterium]|nr:NADPH-dependent FMN reductase [Anaerolineaceae bacterium]